MTHLRPAFTLLLLLTLITGGLYPLLVTALGQWFFPWQASGSLIYQHQQPAASVLIAQAVSGPEFFQPRPSASGDHSWNPALSGGSNLAVSNPALDKQVADRAAALRKENPQASAPIPVELLTASGSGVDPNLTPEAALWQAPRIASARGVNIRVIDNLIKRHTERPFPGFIGQPVVNVITLNQALNGLSPTSHAKEN
ncbi:potassium-transporting ATPase KdpC subunit [Salmonella enterica subsp. enterica serovar Choleraesuis]|nr:potassium-transporting ATPase KdpC subunit [Salmonella enterica subsp. enterica serovar Choleraesuis]